MESFVVVVTWFRSRAARRTEPVGRDCTGCRKAIPGATDDALRASGGVLLEGAGWFCGERCARQYRLRFRIQPALTPTPVPRAHVPAQADPGATAEEPATSTRRSAEDALTAALRARRMKYSSTV